MENTLHLTESVKENMDTELLFSYLDKGIDDIEAGRVYSVDEAFSIIEERLKNEL